MYGPVIWRIPGERREVYFTFDDGPSPVTTERILKLLEKTDIKATFFCLGENAQAYPPLVSLLKAAGHTVANHGFRHLNAWSVDWHAFHKNVIKGRELTGSIWFRPPYGRLWPGYAARLQEEGIRTVMWDVLSGDYRLDVSRHEVLGRCMKLTRAGSIVVFHDQHRSWPVVEWVVPRLAEFLRKQGFNFSALPPEPPFPVR
ncbi:MAG: polysaccharide deacetylase family protein [Flavobacteriales bacterium]|nr:polysaccharide deacetylase family protein [Flavobacteriales bacterium]MDW8410455.1 polysaccharide deacetylase family protein [Flavobacteriales bacterium]